jgi:hypothetical protein
MVLLFAAEATWRTTLTGIVTTMNAMELGGVLYGANKATAAEVVASARFTLTLYDIKRSVWRGQSLLGSHDVDAARHS